MLTVGPDARGLRTAAQFIREGEVAAYPTETVYGLGVNPFSETALKKLFAIKGRPARNPVLLIIGSRDQLPEVAGPLTDWETWCADRLWPGPVSLLLPPAPTLPSALLAGQPKVCVRHTASSIARALCLAYGGAITSTSANPSGAAPATSLAGLNLEGIACGIDAGILAPSAPSTVFDPETGQILRAGALSETELRAAIRR